MLRRARTSAEAAPEFSCRPGSTSVGQLMPRILRELHLKCPGRRLDPQPSLIAILVTHVLYLVNRAIALLT